MASLFKYICTYEVNKIAYMNKFKITKLIGLGTQKFTFNPALRARIYFSLY